MSLYDGVSKVAAGRTKKPACVHTCRPASRGAKENAAGSCHQRDVIQQAMHPGWKWESVRVVDEDQVRFGDANGGRCGYLVKFNDVAVSREVICGEGLIGRLFRRPFLLFPHPSALRTKLCFYPSSPQLPPITSCGPSPYRCALVVCQSALRPAFRAPPSHHTQDFSTTTSAHLQDFIKHAPLTPNAIHSA